MKDPEHKMSWEDEEFCIEYECFCGSLDLFAETCLMRNKENQKILQNGIYEGKLLLAIFEDSQMTDRIRSKALKLYLEACLDIDPFQKLQVPSGQAVLNDLTQLELTGDDLVEAI